MTTMVWSILALMVIIVLIIAGIVIWRKRTDAQVDSLHNIEKQLGEIGDELKIASDGKSTVGVEETSPETSLEDQLPASDADSEMAEHKSEDHVLEEHEPAAEMTAESEVQEEPAEESEAGKVPSIKLPELSDLDGEEDFSDFSDEDEGESEEPEPVLIDIASILGSRFSDDESEEKSTAAENTETQKQSASLYNTGKSGKVYTEEELELLIKE